MTFAPLVIAIGSTIATTIIETATGIPLDPIVAKLKDRLAQKLKLGKYEAIDRALNIARNDVVGQCQTDQHRALVNHVLTILLESNSGPLLDEFGKQVATTYLSTTQNNSSSQSLVKLYRQCCGPAILVRQDIPEETVSNLLELFFQAFRERLLIEEDFEYLRSYCQLYEIRKQTSLQQKIVDSLDALVANTAHPVEDFAAIRQAYFNHLINEFKDHTIRGIAPQVGSRVLSLPLAKIFLPLQAVEGRPALAEFAEEDLLRQAMSDVMSEMDWQRRREETEKRLAQLTARQGAQRALKLVDLLRETRVVLLGDPGTGKTTTTRYIAYALAADDTTHTGNNVRGLTPILVRIANYAKAYEQDKTLHLIEYIERELMQRSEFGRYLRYAIEMGQCLIILDGLDEIGVPSLRVEVTQRIQAMVASFSDNQFIVSSRIVGYDQSPLTREFKHATLQDLNQEDREHFISLWYDAINTEITSTEHAGSANDLIDALRAKPPIARMAANPLLLTIMVLMHWRGVKLPSRRVQVYQNATDTLIEYWTAQRHVAELDAEEIKAILAPIAHYILSSGVSGVIAHHELLPRFYAGLVEQRGCNEAEARQLGREMLKNLNEQSGIFLERGLDTNSQPVYGFLHQTFGEYLAAFYLAQQMLNGVFKLELYIHRSIWHEPLLLMAGHLSIINQTRVNTLIRDILDFPALHEEMLQRNLLLAADCLADDVQVNPTLRQEVLERLAKLLDHAATQVREAALNRFRRLAVTRYRELAANAIEQSYQILDSEKFSIVDNQTRINIAKALVALGETTTARPIVWQLDAQQRHLAIRDYERDYEIRKLRFEGWPQEADEYLLQLQANGKTNFSVSAGLTLEKCTLGSIDAATAKLVLGETKLLAVLDALLTHMKGDSAQATLRWIAAITPQMPVIETLLNLTSTEIPPHVRQLAAARLLNTTQRTVGIQVLQELAEHEPTTAASAVKSLLDADEMIILNWNLLCDTALLANHPNAPAAINILLRTGQMNIAVPAAIHLFSTCLLSYNRDQRLNHVMQSLLQHGQSELGLAVARWLALRSGYSYRLQACEALLESGRVTETYPLLQFLAYETHDTASQRACQHLLKYKEGMSIAPLLISVAQKAEPTLRYQACLAMTLASDQSIAWATSQSSRSNLKLKLFHERQQASHTAVNDFIRQAANALDVLTLIDDNAQAAQWLGKLSLLWLEKEANTRGQDTAVKYELNRMPKQALAVIQLNAALFSLRLGQWRSTQQTLFRLHQQAIQMFSLPIQQTLVTILGKIVNHQTTTQILFALTNQDSSVRSSAIRALGTLGDATVLPALITALSDEDSSVRSAAVYALGSLGMQQRSQPSSPSSPMKIVTCAGLRSMP